MYNIILSHVPLHKNRTVLYRLADHILRTSSIIWKVTNCVSQANFDCLHKNRKQEALTNFHLGTLQEAKKETNLRYTENTVTLKKKKNAVTHKLRWERSWGLDPDGLRIFIQLHDVTQDSKDIKVQSTNKRRLYKGEGEINRVLELWF